MSSRRGTIHEVLAEHIREANIPAQESLVLSVPDDLRKEGDGATHTLEGSVHGVVNDGNFFHVFLVVEGVTIKVTAWKELVAATCAA